MKKFCKKHEKKLGTFSAILAVAMFASMAEIFLTNFRGETKIWILPLATIFNCAGWCGYSIAKNNDPFIFFPNFLGLILATATFLVAIF